MLYSVIVNLLLMLLKIILQKNISKRLVDYPNLWNYCCNLYQQPGIPEVSSVSHVKELYYKGILEINPHGIIPLGPKLDFSSLQ